MRKDKWFRAGVIITWVSWFISWILIITQLDWLFFFIFLLFGLGLSGFVIWIIILPRLIESEREIEILKKNQKGGKKND